MDRPRIALAVPLLFLATISVAKAQVVNCSGSQLSYFETGNTTSSFGPCPGWGICRDPVPGGATVSFDSPGCDPLSTTCGMTATVPVEFPGNHQNNPGLTGGAYSFAEVQLLSSAGGVVGHCGTSGAVIQKDLGTTTVTASVSCLDAASLKYTLQYTMCPPGPGACVKTKTVPLDFGTAAGCPVPLPNTCTEGSGGSSGAAGTSCPLCQPVGGEAGCSVPVGGGGPSCEPSWLGKAQLRYAAGGVGGDGLPGSTAWRAALGRFWSHDFAERIVADPDSSHAWLLTRHGSFREFSNLAAGSGLRLYQGRAPSDEFRRLYFDTATGGWELHSLDGRKDYFGSDGRWLQTVLASDPGHPIQAAYNGSSQLVSVSFPDGRSDVFIYHPGGKLASITETAVAGSGTPSRTWTFTWSGDELTLATRPDGTAWQFFYDGSRPGYLERVDLIAGPHGRVMAGFEYQPGSNNVARSWRGDPVSGGPNAVDKVGYAYTNPTRPTQTGVTREISATFDQVTTYSLGRDSASSKPKITSVQGSCPTCGLSPTTIFAYGSNPLLPASMTDAKGTRTDFTYDENGRLLTRTEAANKQSLARVSTYTYDSNHPGLVTGVEVPSTSGGANKRRTGSAHDPATGLPTARTTEGWESGAPFLQTTLFTYNASGEILTLDPPGSSTADVTSYTYTLAGRNGHIADSRTDPMVGTTFFGFDGLNRRASVIDPNGVETVTSYDNLNRVTEVRQKGATPAEDLVTVYTYTVFGDLFCTRLPRGNGIEHAYDGAGRLTAILRGTAVATPDSTSCLDAALPRERTAYQLDGRGNQVEESLERWTGSAWVSESKTAYEFTCHLDRMTAGAGSTALSVTEYCYDVNDNLEKVWDPNHPRGSNPEPTQLHVYDALNRLTSTIVGPGTAAAAATTYTYDAQDHLTGVTDAEGNTTLYTYSDRDLLTKEESPVSGIRTYAYNEQGELEEETDARGVTVIRAYDVLDRLIAVSYPDPSLDVTYTYDAPGAFAVGRLTGITRHGETVAYEYDRFGRMTRDGDLTYAYDGNGNRTTIGYPAQVTVVYTYDHADRQKTLALSEEGNTPFTLVSAASYKPFGPLASLLLGNGLVETRAYDERYHPLAIQVGGTNPLLDWSYTVDPVGNITEIQDVLAPVNNRTYGYQDFLYFLTQGDGPWGPRSWTYDRIGNRLSETRGAVIDTYSYSGGHNPKLLSVTEGGGNTTLYGYDQAGNTMQIVNDQQQLDLVADAAGSMAFLRSLAEETFTSFRYDGRSYLREASEDYTGCLARKTIATYSSKGLLHRREHRLLADSTFIGGDSVLYFAGRPVAVLEQSDTVSNLSFLSTDHLGTPVLATNDSGGEVWEGGFEPFGEDWNGASGAGVFLRFPGQWVDEVWQSGGDGLRNNVHRWYDPGWGRYTQPDPIGLLGGDNLYLYVGGNPITSVDPTGLVDETRFSTQGEIAELTERHCARQVFLRNYLEMREANWKPAGTDQYFHCKANCEAVRCGTFGFKEACGLSDMREFMDQLTGDPALASQIDQAANRFGREESRKQSHQTCKVVCSKYRPPGLPAKY